MFAIFNIFLIVYLILMAYYWGAVQGLFSGLLHLVTVIVAGAVALALWEPVTLGLLMGRMPAYAWGLGLVGPFVLVLIGLRMALDKLIPANMHFSALINSLLGAVFGLLAGILTAGITLIGLTMLPLPDAFLGWQPALVGDKGQVVFDASGKLWVPVDRMAGGFYSTLSAGALGRGLPLHEYRAGLVDTAQTMRVRYDPNASILARPDGVSAAGLYEHPVPVPGVLGNMLAVLSDAPAPTGNLVVADTQWKKDAESAGQYDEDGVLRIPPAQVRLVAVPAVGNASTPMTVLQPRAVSVQGAHAKSRTFISLADDKTQARLETEGQLGWIFIVPAGLEPKFLLVRGLRLALPEAKTNALLVAAAVGRLPGAPEAAESGKQVIEAGKPAPASQPTAVVAGAATGVVAGAKADWVALSNALPRVVSANSTGPLRLEGQSIFSGTSDVPAPTIALNAQTRVTDVQVPGHQACVRVKVLRDQAQSIFGRARGMATMLQAIYLEDTNGDHYLPFGYVWVHDNDKQKISFDRTHDIQSARELPIVEMQGNDELYLYFLLPKGTTLRAYFLGPQNRQAVDLAIPK